MPEDSKLDKILKPIKKVIDFIIPILKGQSGIPAQIITILLILSGILGVLISVF